ncbi:hypothetical protein SS50377_25164 [Spironucleus salmonicida]|uniref:Uncharacterized protein n=1 Tax=Spironucleus salmonicida TaxID=348837 RepID=A0A9P8LRV1_9EUKA|nr:hypothetical protein SS50377_25164 [Spironucleus salmonicida]
MYRNKFQSQTFISHIKSYQVQSTGIQTQFLKTIYCQPRCKLHLIINLYSNTVHQKQLNVMTNNINSNQARNQDNTKQFQHQQQIHSIALYLLYIIQLPLQRLYGTISYFIIIRNSFAQWFNAQTYTNIKGITSCKFSSLDRWWLIPQRTDWWQRNITLYLLIYGWKNFKR